MGYAPHTDINQNTERKKIFRVFVKWCGRFWPDTGAPRSCSTSSMSFVSWAKPSIKCARASMRACLPSFPIAGRSQSSTVYGRFLALRGGPAGAVLGQLAGEAALSTAVKYLPRYSACEASFVAVKVMVARPGVAHETILPGSDQPGALSAPSGIPFSPGYRRGDATSKDFFIAAAGHFGLKCRELVPCLKGGPAPTRTGPASD
jgi:hypothetical protein